MEMDGCTACWKNEATPRVFWQDTRGDASRRVTDTRAARVVSLPSLTRPTLTIDRGPRGRVVEASPVN